MVFGVVTDYASNMKKAWRPIEENFPTIICYRCAAHGLNLIFCDMIKTRNEQKYNQTSESCHKRIQAQTHAS